MKIQKIKFWFYHRVLGWSRRFRHSQPPTQATSRSPPLLGLIRERLKSVIYCPVVEDNFCQKHTIFCRNNLKINFDFWKSTLNMWLTHVMYSSRAINYYIYGRLIEIFWYGRGGNIRPLPYSKFNLSLPFSKKVKSSFFIFSGEDDVVQS